MKDSILEFLQENLSIVLGVGGGLLLGILLLTLGFWRTLLLIILCSIGGIVGRDLKNGVDIPAKMLRIFDKIKNLFTKYFGRNFL